MKIKLLTLVLFSLLIYFPIQSQTLHVVQLIGNSFQPSTLTISVGDTVRWENTGGGLHNVVADDNSFTSGTASTANWTYEHVFNALGDFQYYCQIHGAAGGIGMSGKITVQGTTDVKDNINAAKYNLAQNFPNPFNPTTSINVTVEKTNYTELTIYNSIGEQVTNLVSKTLTPGTYTFSWDAANFPSGIYFYRIVSGGFIDVKKMTLLK